ncbi:MAG TPA: adenylate/guanylate cyclase domain-containing protein [Cyanobacteria bacterium UBA11149]|nr:adenylate/guanylate cyclase domain-containing protein [Cyanobacteria bacterium UBA11367]HBE58287.1 adenylate/guanylate cyclase domain-containing protein [Cyanobacteria bacterium UBA11366]HBR73016.1 adenylate/guanylate cyclase domain-containing protein [Cyanobacteria bacterium UBA11159]HBS68898.1 adenylate/guanylate cyclase domain-containing protein [Cyanobacteria bacterium UBA11153]HBW88163.1 adenylate/guanylate cyclase domain-containing protein [Cyanobacteria bacterium UBA11149]HCA97206.1 
MSSKLFGICNSLKARLSRRIVFWVFTSIVVVEAIILVPSYFRREEELFNQIEHVSEVIFNATVRWKRKGESDKVILEKIPILMSDREILGIAIYRSNGELFKVLGDAPKISFSALKNPKNNKICGTLRDGDRYDVAWSGLPQGIDYILIVRHNSSSVKHELHAFILRISGLVVIIAICVTGTTMLALGATVIVPILRLRDDLMAAAEAISKETANPNFYSLSVKRHDELGDVMAAFNQMFERISWEYMQRKEAEAILRIEREKSDNLLLNILPEAIAQRLKQKQSCIADGFAAVTILFADIVGFTQLSSQISPTELVNLLNDIFSAFDCLTEIYGLEKIKTIGDAYMVASGLPMMRPDHADAIANMALDMQKEVKKFNQRHHANLNIRIGINSGEVVAGVIGTKKFIYDLWGDAVNTASRMESHGEPGRIQVTAATYKYLQDKYVLEERGIIYVKGKGEMITYFLIGKKEE